MSPPISHEEQAQVCFNRICKARDLQLDEAYFPVLFEVAEALAGRETPTRSTLGIGGAQGSGKSTFSHLLADVLAEAFSVPSLVLSMDDFYLSRAERQSLSSIHPLLVTRGVPGTHDLAMMLTVRDQFKRGETLRLPQFSKAEDDRVGYREQASDGFDLLIFEGWCWGAGPQPETALAAPVNELENKEDVTGDWRRYVNDQLAAYQPLFDTDFSLYLKVPDLESVRRWRWQQEQGLPAGPGRMSEQDIARFVMHYERITSELLKTREQQVDICIELDTNHRLRLSKLEL